MTSTLEARMADPQGALLSVVVLDAAVAGFVVGGFWLAVSLMRSLRQEGRILPGAPRILTAQGRFPGGDRRRGWPSASVP